MRERNPSAAESYCTLLSRMRTVDCYRTCFTAHLLAHPSHITYSHSIHTLVSRARTRLSHLLRTSPSRTSTPHVLSHLHLSLLLHVHHYPLCIRLARDHLHLNVVTVSATSSSPALRLLLLLLLFLFPLLFCLLLHAQDVGVLCRCICISVGMREGEGEGEKRALPCRAHCRVRFKNHHCTAASSTIIMPFGWIQPA